MVTIKDVAKQANVSVATVSAVINGNKFVSEPLKQRVEEAIAALHYRPNKIARSLKKKETHLIGVAVTEVTNPFYPLLLKGVEDAAIDAGYNVLLCTTGDDPDKELDLVQSMIDQGVDGVILGTVDQEQSLTLALLKKEGIPHVLINRSPSSYDGSAARINNHLVGEQAAFYLTNLGHSNIAFVGGSRLNSLEREQSFMSTLASMDIYLPSDKVIRTDYSIAQTYQDVQPLLTEDTHPTAFFTGSDFMAFGVIKALLDAGCRVPEDVSVIGSDNIPFSEDFRVPLTTIDSRAYELGKNGSELLIEEMKTKDLFTPKKILLEPVLIERESCQPRTQHS